MIEDYIHYREESKKEKVFLRVLCVFVVRWVDKRLLHRESAKTLRIFIKIVILCVLCVFAVCQVHEAAAKKKKA